MVVRLCGGLACPRWRTMNGCALHVTPLQGGAVVKFLVPCSPCMCKEKWAGGHRPFSYILRSVACVLPGRRSGMACAAAPVGLWLAAARPNPFVAIITPSLQCTASCHPLPWFLVVPV